MNGPSEMGHPCGMGSLPGMEVINGMDRGEEIDKPCTREASVRHGTGDHIEEVRKRREGPCGM
eukprot:5105890-Prorocentrum_lima.AAC.1